MMRVGTQKSNQNEIFAKLHIKILNESGRDGLLGRGGEERGNKSAHKAETKRRAAKKKKPMSQWKNGIEINGQVMASGQKGNAGKNGNFWQIAKFYLEMKCVLLGAPAGPHQCATICPRPPLVAFPSLASFLRHFSVNFS